VDFESLSWQQGGHPLEIKKKHPEAPLTLLEFAPGFEDPVPCSTGHAGLVLEGTLAFVLEDGTEVRVPQGGAFLLDPGTLHRARNPGKTAVRLFVYSFTS